MTPLRTCLLIGLALSTAAWAAIPTPPDHAQMPPGGLVVLVGDNDGQVANSIASTAKWLVHSIGKNATDTQAVEAATDAYSGLVSVSTLGVRLPFGKDTVNRLIIDRDAVGTAALADSEIQRVLAPRGILQIRQGGNWTSTVEPVDPDHGDWTHSLSNAQSTAVSNDRAVAPSTSLRWWSHITPTADLRSKDGLVATTAEYKMTNEFVGRDGYSGVPLWKGTSNHWGWKADAASFVAVPGGFITHPGSDQYARLYDAKTGAVLRAYDQGSLGPPASATDAEFGPKPASDAGRATASMCTDGTKLYQFRGRAVYSLDVATGNRNWMVSVSDPVSKMALSVDGTRLYLLETTHAQWGWNRWGSKITTTAVTALDTATGNVAWRNTDAATMKVNEFSVRGDRLYLWSNYNNLGNALFRMMYFKQSDGQMVYLTPTVDVEDVVWMTNNVVLWNDKAWAWGPSNKGLHSYSLDTPGLANILATGGIGGNQRCTRISASENYLIFGFTTYFDKQNGYTQSSIARGDCGYHAFPCNAAVNFITDLVCSCYNGLRGLLSLVPADPLIPVADSTRASVPPTVPVSAAATVPSTQLVAEWVPHKLPFFFLPENVKPVVSGNITLTTDTQRHLVTATNSSNATIWQWRAGGRIWRSPTITGNRVYVGACDGRVTSLNLATGVPVWSFLAAPNEDYMVVSGQIESRWPVYGVLFHENLLYAAAGRHMEIDGGIYCWQLDPVTGAPLKKVRFYTPPDVLLNGDTTPRPQSVRWRGVRETITKGMINGGMMVGADGRAAVRVPGWYKKDSRASLHGYFRPLNLRTGLVADQDKQDPESPITSAYIVDFNAWDNQTINSYLVTAGVETDANPPEITQSISINPPTVTGNTATVSALAVDPDPLDTITYNWVVTGPVAAAVSGNGPSETITFTKAGTYSIALEVVSSQNGKATDSLDVVVQQTPTGFQVRDY